mgnify:CR=1 FL=1
MQKYFVSDEDFNNNIITGDDCFHVKNVMRNKINDVILIGNNHKCYKASIKKINKDDISFEIIEEIFDDTELNVRISLFQGYPKLDKLSLIIKHSVELGVYDITPTIMKRSLFKLDDKKKDNKNLRFNKIAKEAAEQSYRMIVPNVNDISYLKDIDFSSYDLKLVCYEEDAKNNNLSSLKESLDKIKENDKIAIVIGPEGGIDKDEIDYLKEKGFISVALGKRILRTETAPLYILSLIGYEVEVRK